MEFGCRITLIQVLAKLLGLNNQLRVEVKIWRKFLFVQNAGLKQIQALPHIECLSLAQERTLSRRLWRYTAKNAGQFKAW
jgi:hypothetical protein